MRTLGAGSAFIATGNAGGAGSVSSNKPLRATNQNNYVGWPVGHGMIIAHRHPALNKRMQDGLKTWVRLVENDAMVTPTLVRKVRQMANHIAKDIADDLPKGPAFVQRIRLLLQTIHAEEPIGDKMNIFRAELRPRSALDTITSVGSHWCWDPNAAQVYHHDNATDEHGDDDLVNILLDGTAAYRAIDWPYSIATNLIHPAEREITLRNNAQVYLNEIIATDIYIEVNRMVSVSGYYRE